MQDNKRNEKIYRTDIATWYDISERCLRDRMQTKQLKIANRVLTDDDNQNNFECFRQTTKFSTRPLRPLFWQNCHLEPFGVN